MNIRVLDEPDARLYQELRLSALSYVSFQFLFIGQNKHCH
ncbi:hypothetical protein SAMN05443246_4620 [Paenibacillus sp. GP183]|jgi:hypothetical protein|nr:hypothetical protein SAMN05443246_4620 [Paenibacillus sp. GP183]